MSVTRTLRTIDDEELFWGLYIIGVVAYGVYMYSKEKGRREGREAAQSLQEWEAEQQRAMRRDDLQLGEEALCHLEHGGTVELERWHGGELTIAAEEIVVDVTTEEESNA